MKVSALKTRTVQTLRDEIEQIRRQTTERAYEAFRRRGAQLASALDDWLSAERQTIWKPAIEVCEKENAFIIEASVAGVEPRDLDVQVTPDTVLIKAGVSHAHTDQKGTVHICEFAPGRLFRLIQLAAVIDPDSVKAECQNGLLRITAPIAVPKQVTADDVKAA